MEAVSKAIESGGGIRSVSKRIGIGYEAVRKWKKSGHVPAERVLKLEELSGISRCELRPDLYPLSSTPSLVAKRKRA